MEAAIERSPACREFVLPDKRRPEVKIIGPVEAEMNADMKSSRVLWRRNDDLSLHRSWRFRITRMQPMERRLLHLGVTSIVSVKMGAAAVLDGISNDRSFTFLVCADLPEPSPGARSISPVVRPSSRSRRAVEAKSHVCRSREAWRSRVRPKHQSCRSSAKSPLLRRAR